MLVSIEDSEREYIYMVIYTVFGCFLTSVLGKFNSHEINAALVLKGKKLSPYNWHRQRIVSVIWS